MKIQRTFKTRSQRFYLIVGSIIPGWTLTKKRGNGRMEYLFDNRIFIYDDDINIFRYKDDLIWR